MSYYTRLSGELKIVPPLTYSEFKDSLFVRFVEWNDGGASVFKLEVAEDSRETPEGVLTVKTAMAVQVCPESVNAYHAEEGLQRLVDAFPGHRFVGCIEGDGEDQFDAWRLYVISGRVVKVKPVISWPDAPVDSEGAGK